MGWTDVNKSPGGEEAPTGTVTTLSRVMRLRGQYNIFPPESQEREEKFMQYEEVVKMVENSEKRVDEMLRAARLERHERQPMNKDMLAMLLNYAVGTLAMVLGFAALFLIIYYMGR